MLNAEMNRIHNASNPNQGPYKKVLCCCSAGLLRSPTAALVLSQEPYCYNTRSAGLVDDYALIRVDDALLEWADEIVVMDPYQGNAVRERLEKVGLHVKPVIVLDIPDNYTYRNPDLIDEIRRSYDTAVNEV